MASERIVRPGLEGVAAAETRLSSVDGRAGELVIAGFPLEELAGRATFEETVYLLWRDALPDARELEAFRRELAERRAPAPAALEALQAPAPPKLPVMDALRIAAGPPAPSARGPRPPD